MPGNLSTDARLDFRQELTTAFLEPRPENEDHMSDRKRQPAARAYFQKEVQETLLVISAQRAAGQSVLCVSRSEERKN